MSGSTIPVWYGLVSTLAPLGGGVFGYFLSGRNDEKRDQRAIERDRAGKQLERDAVRDVWSHEFQRDLLLELQDQLQRLSRSTYEQIKSDRETLQTAGRLTLLPEGLSDEAFELTIELNRVRERILDEQLRERVTSFFEECTRLSMEAPLEVGVMDRDDPDHLKAILVRNERQLFRSYEAITKEVGVTIRREIGPTA